jgi:hypothetical protein
MLTIYLKIGPETDYSLIFQILGHMPYELFSASEAIVFTDREGLETAS